MTSPTPNSNLHGGIQVLPGPVALSPFRIEKLQSDIALRPGGEAVKLVHLAAQYVHFVQLKAGATLTDAEVHVLQRLLTYATPFASGEFGQSVVVTPRVGTVSPWSSKATDIAWNCGLASIARIERATQFYFDVDGALSLESRATLVAALHDRMTESVFATTAEAAPRLFAQHPPRALQHVDIAAGRAALAAANSDLGLALSDDEVDYLLAYYQRIKRHPTDVELMMFAQANSEHCRHKIFNASWSIDGKAMPRTLFGMIKNTHHATPQGTVVAYNDNAAVMQGAPSRRWFPRPAAELAVGQWAFHEDMTHILMKVETHNHPTAIAPYAGAATGAGGEIRDEGATGRGAKPKVGVTGFTVSHLNIPGFVQPWETDIGRPGRMVSALTIMIEGPIGGAAFNNEFGRPNLGGYFRTFQQEVSGEVRGYLKPIMIAGGIGNVSDRHTKKADHFETGTLFIQLGGPGFLIGLGGGAASSMAAGANAEALDFDSVQRANAEMQRRCQEVIDACWQMGDANPILSIHDVGAGGLSNALPELAHSGAAGATFNLRRVLIEEHGMSPKEIWSNEAQERYVLAIAPASLPLFKALCERERCLFAVVGEATRDGQLQVLDPHFSNAPVDMEMETLLGKPPRMHREVTRVLRQLEPLKLEGLSLKEAAYRVLNFPAVADKTFLVSIGDRTVGGMTARDQMVGPWQVPVADCAVTTLGYTGFVGEAMAMGERTPLALISGPASGRMAVGEALLNLAASNVATMQDIKLSANWMAPAGHPGEDAVLYDTVEAIGIDFCPALGLSIPVGKDSMSMKTSWHDGAPKSVTAPVSLIITAFARVADVRKSLTPQLRSDRGETELILVDLGAGKNRMGGGVLAQVFGQMGDNCPDVDDASQLKALFLAIQAANAAGLILAYHDRSDGGLLTTLAEMAFAGRTGVTIYLDSLLIDSRNFDVDGNEIVRDTALALDHTRVLSALFNEELGAVLQVRRSDRDAVTTLFRDAGLGRCTHVIGHLNDRNEMRVVVNGTHVLTESRVDLHRAWSATTHRMQRLRDNPTCADEEYARIADAADPGLSVKLTYDMHDDVAAPLIATGVRPRVAVLREQGVNSQAELARAFDIAGFDVFDVHMTDVISGRVSLTDFKGVAAAGGFSYGDVLGAGEGWSKSILFNSRARDEFEAFFRRSDTFALGVCNGCQMMSNLKEIIPGAQNWPHFGRNLSEQYEARLVMVEVMESPSIFFKGMEGSRIPIVTAHGEGRATFANRTQEEACRWLTSLRFVDNQGKPTQTYPLNPNGSTAGVTAVTTPDGRFTVLMPHPERTFRGVLFSWHPDGWDEESPWMRVFRNARVWVG